MATRSNIVIKDGKNKTYLYHHWDGDLTGVGAQLKRFASGIEGEMNAEDVTNKILSGLTKSNGSTDSTYERTSGIHDDAEYVYTIDVNKGTLSYKQWDYNKNKWSRPSVMYQGTPSSAYASIVNNKNSISRAPRKKTNTSTSSKGNTAK